MFKIENVNTGEELNLEQKVTVKNISDWDVGFSRVEGVGDVLVPPRGSVRLSRSEIISQVQKQRTVFTGTDGNGTHATLYIDDEATRKTVGFDSEDGETKQEVFNDKLATKLFGIKNQTSFENSVKDAIKTRAEKYAIISAVNRLNLNDYRKIRFLEEYTGYKVQ